MIHTSPAIALKNISQHYANGIPVLRHVSLAVAQGSFSVLIGPSGCGKSTILKLLTGIEKETSGTLTIAGETSMVFQNGALFPWLTVYENVAFGISAENAHRDVVKRETEKYIELMGLSAFTHKYPRELSGGQRQRVGIARALAIDPAIILLDEPFSALDPKTTEELHAELLRIWELTKKTILMVSHSIEEAVLLGDTVSLMKEGKIVQTFDITLPRARSMDSKKFLEHVTEIRTAFFNK